MLGDAKTFVGSLEHAMAAMPTSSSCARSSRASGHTSDEEFNSLIKALEVGGVTADESKMHERLETFAKIMNVFKETIHPGDFSSFYNQAGIAARTLSGQFHARRWRSSDAGDGRRRRGQCRQYVHERAGSRHDAARRPWRPWTSSACSIPPRCGTRPMAKSAGSTPAASAAAISPAPIPTVD